MRSFRTPGPATFEAKVDFIYDMLQGSGGDRPGPARLVGVQRAAKLLGLDTETVRGCSYAGIVPAFIETSGRLHFLEVELHDFLSSERMTKQQLKAAADEYFGKHNRR